MEPRFCGAFLFSDSDSSYLAYHFSFHALFYSVNKYLQN